MRALGIQVDVIEIKGLPKLKHFEAISNVWERMKSVDIIHAHYGYCGWVARSQLNKPVVVSFMGNDLLGTPDAYGHIQPISRIEVFFNLWLARMVNAVIVKSVEMAKIIGPVKAHVLPNGVDMQTFYPIPRPQARALLEWSEDKLYISFPGNPAEPRKGFLFAKAAIHQAEEQMGKPLAVIPLLNIPPHQVPLYMSACDLMIMTSFIEGSPNVVKEAMACNLPIVSVPVGDTAELLKDVKGCVVSTRDVNRFAEDIVNLLKAKRSSNGREALQHKGLDLESIARRLIKIYESVLARGA